MKKQNKKKTKKKKLTFINNTINNMIFIAIICFD